MAEKGFFQRAKEVAVPRGAVHALTTKYDRTIRYSSSPAGRIERAIDVVSHHLVVGFSDNERQEELLRAADAGELVFYRTKGSNQDLATRYDSIGLSEWNTLMHSTRKTLRHPVFVYRSFKPSGEKDSRLIAIKKGDLPQGQDNPPKRIRVQSETGDLPRTQQRAVRRLHKV